MRPLLGYAAACGVVLIWSSWLVASRSGALSPLSVYDLAALRFGVSALIAMPVMLYLKPWRTISWQRMLVLAFLLGPIYILMVYGGFKYAPAAHGGIFMNGVLPAMTLFLAWFWLSERAQVPQLIGAAIIMIATVLAVTDGLHSSFTDSWLGDLMFMLSGLSLAGYMVASRKWQITLPQSVLCSSCINAVIYVPIWYLFLPSQLAEASNSQIALQVVYQGIIPTLIGLLLLTYAVRQIGSPVASAFMSAVPGLGALLSFVFLGEKLGLLGWLGLILLTIGIAVVALMGKPSRA